MSSSMFGGNGSMFQAPPGASWGLVAAERNENANLVSRLNAANSNLDDWIAEGTRLKIDRDAWRESAYTHDAASVGQIALKKAALEELNKLDPSNKMMDIAYRKEIFEKAYDDYIAKIKE